VLRVTSVEDMIHLLQGLTGTVMPRGNRLCILTNAGGPAIMAADAADGHGLVMATLSDQTKQRIRKILPPEASVENPIDMIASAGPDNYEKVLELVLADDAVDLVVTIFVPPLVVDPLEVMGRITRVARAGGKTVLSVLMAEESYYERIPARSAGSGAVLPLSRRRGEGRRADESVSPVARTTGRDHAGIHRGRETGPRDCRREARSGGGYLAPSDTQALLDAFGFPTVGQVVVSLTMTCSPQRRRLRFLWCLKS
jgi:acyl-CoA synthetase (NDP forming)